MTREEEDKREFELCYDSDLDNRPFGFVPLVLLESLKSLARKYWLEGRRTLREKPMEEEGKY